MKNTFHASTAALALVFATFAGTAHAETLTFSGQWNDTWSFSNAGINALGFEVGIDSDNGESVGIFVFRAPGYAPAQFLFGFMSPEYLSSPDLQFAVDWASSWIDDGNGSISLAGIPQNDWSQVGGFIDFGNPWGMPPPGSSPTIDVNNAWYWDIPIDWERAVSGSDNQIFGSITYHIISGTTSSVPEPTTPALLLAGLGLLGVVARRRRNLERR
jgi:hypothetical protein